MRQVLFLTAALALVPACAPAADPIDEDLAKLADVRAKQADLKKVEDTLVEKLRKQHQANHEKLVAAGVIAPGPPPPAPEPKPVDVLKQKIAAAFERDGKPVAAAHQLAALYRLAAGLAAKPEILSTAMLKARVSEAAAELMKEFPPDEKGALPLKAVRQAVSEEWLSAVGKVDDEPITDAERAAAAKLFGRLADILEAVQ